MRAPIRIDRPPILNRAHPTTTAGADRSWYRVVNRADADTAEVWIYDEIGWDVESGPFARDLAAIDAKHIRVRMNTPGGSVFDGLAIYNALLSHPADVTVQVDGLAASAGSFIAQAGDTVVMGRNSQMMIHDAAGICLGNAEDMTAMADLLDRVSDNIAGVYADRAGGTVAQWRDRMRDETWFSAEEAVKAGLADAMAPAPKRRGEDGEDSDGEDMPADPDEMDPDEDDDDEKVAALLKQHDLTGRYRYPGRDAAPEPVPVPAEPAAMIPGEAPATGGIAAGLAPIVGERGPEPFTVPAGATITGAAGATITVVYTAPADEDDDEPGADETPETPAPGSPAPTPEPAPEPDDTDTTEDTGDEGQDDEPAPDAEPTARGWADLTGHLTTPDTWAALTGKLTQHHRTTEPSITDLLARLRHKEPTA